MRGNTSAVLWIYLDAVHCRSEVQWLSSSSVHVLRQHGAKLYTRREHNDKPVPVDVLHEPFNAIRVQNQDCNFFTG